jgi:hypothetical protein
MSINLTTIEDVEEAFEVLLSDAPQILADSQGTGSLAKYVKLAGDAATVASQVVAAVGSHPAVTAPATPTS